MFIILLNIGGVLLKDIYESPFSSRYSSKEMLKIFSSDTKFRIWRKLWIALAESQMELGLDISKDQIQEMKSFENNINYHDAQKKESEINHDVMAHLYAYGIQCPKAKPIMHLGATSCYVGDNTDIIIIHQALKLIENKLVILIKALSDFAVKYKDVPTLAFTHFQPAQPTTVGKRASLWIQDLMIDLKEISYRISQIKLPGCKGTTGTQASFLALFKGDHQKVKELELRIAQKMGYDKCFPVMGQTYPRKFDSQILSCLSGIAQSASKFSNDIRLLQHLKEIEEPFSDRQVGSSAMAYKRNPVICERIASLSRLIIVQELNPALTASAQWFERTLDDSANKRICISESFLATDAIIELYISTAKGLIVYPKVIEKHLNDEMPFMCTENIIMNCVNSGGDRQELHEHIRVHSMECSRLIKQEGAGCDLLNRISKDPVFNIPLEETIKISEPKDYIGRAAEQTYEYINQEVMPIINKYIK